MTWFDIGAGDRVWIETDEDRKNKVKKDDEIETGENIENEIENEIEDIIENESGK